MQSDWKEIYKLTAKRTEENEQIYKDIGNFVFTHLYYSMRRPEHLIIKLKGVGTWFLRRMRMKAIVQLFPPDFDKTREDFESPLGFLKNENKKEIYEVFKKRLEDYERYIAIRNETRKIRYATQTLLGSPDGKNEGGTSSQDKSS